MDTNSSSSPLYARLANHNNLRGGFVIAFLWGLAEATVFFLVPDIYLGFAGLFNWRKGLLATAFVVAGSVLGGAIMYALAAHNAVEMNKFLTALPLINTDMVNSVKEQVQTNGVGALLTGPLQGIPYKVYAVQAGEQGIPLLSFLLATIPARLERVLPVVLAGAITGVAFRKYIQHHTSLVLGAYVALWGCIYTLYYFRFR